MRPNSLAAMNLSSSMPRCPGRGPRQDSLTCVTTCVFLTRVQTAFHSLVTHHLCPMLPIIISSDGCVLCVTGREGICTIIALLCIALEPQPHSQESVFDLWLLISVSSGQFHVVWLIPWKHTTNAAWLIERICDNEHHGGRPHFSPRVTAHGTTTDDVDLIRRDRGKRVKIYILGNPAIETFSLETLRVNGHFCGVTLWKKILKNHALGQIYICIKRSWGM
jgi:hypothetical protein